MISKIYSFLGLAMKAGGLISGEDSCERAIKSKKALLVLVTRDASENTKKKFSDICAYRGVQIRDFGSKDLLGKYIGKDIRSVVVVTKEGFAARLMEMIDKYNLESGGGLIGKS
jgi:ribosomal protein L7Ae-like RNA K-turn-binding protein